MSKLKTFDQKQTNWLGLWWHPKYGGFYSSVISLSELRKFKGKVRLCVRKNKYYNKGENNRPNYCFSFKEADADVFNLIKVIDDDIEYATKDEEGYWKTNNGDRLYTYDEVRIVKDGACYDGKDGYYPGDLLVEDYV